MKKDRNIPDGKRSEHFPLTKKMEERSKFCKSEDLANDFAILFRVYIKMFHQKVRTAQISKFSSTYFVC